MYLRISAQDLSDVLSENEALKQQLLLGEVAVLFAEAHRAELREVIADQQASLLRSEAINEGLHKVIESNDQEIRVMSARLNEYKRSEILRLDQLGRLATETRSYRDKLASLGVAVTTFADQPGALLDTNMLKRLLQLCFNQPGNKNPIIKMVAVLAGIEYESAKDLVFDAHSEDQSIVVNSSTPYMSGVQTQQEAKVTVKDNEDTVPFFTVPSDGGDSFIVDVP